MRECGEGGEGATDHEGVIRKQHWRKRGLARYVWLFCSTLVGPSRMCMAAMDVGHRGLDPLWNCKGRNWEAGAAASLVVEGVSIHRG